MESLTGKTSEEVKIPKLAENGRNWNIYHTKIIEATAMDITDPLGVLAGWQPDDGSYNWECLDAILKWTFYTSVPISILCPIRKLDTAHEIFNYLAKCFCDLGRVQSAMTQPRNGMWMQKGMKKTYQTLKTSLTDAWSTSTKKMSDGKTCTRALRHQ